MCLSVVFVTTKKIHEEKNCMVYQKGKCYATTDTDTVNGVDNITSYRHAQKLRNV